MHKLTVFNLAFNGGNADCSRIDLENGRKLLVDYAYETGADPDGVGVDLPTELRQDLIASKRNGYDVVCFTHLDVDHYRGSSDFFWLEHAEKYQGKDRTRITTMWVPAAFITEAGIEDSEGKVLQKEARHRFKNGKGIRVFSRPGRLEDWCSKNGVKFEDRKSLIYDAGKILDEFSIDEDGFEVFVHSPFAVRQDENSVEDRNGDCIVFQGEFDCSGARTKLLMMGDSTWEALVDIVNITKSKGNDSRLEWDIAKLPHHCSYRSLSDEQGQDTTMPKDEIKWLYEDQALEGGAIISTSKPIPEKGTAEDKDKQPPHRQAASYYRSIVRKNSGQFLVTLEHPTKKSPEPIVIEIKSSKATVKKSTMPAAAAIISKPTPRAGC
ncbi:MAG: hypothetical protein FKY71_06675 [Spiribacter salinus]|uniref:MBL fold metallo-hydrolase n=1 Tax=Spiribacter salinus TaxID=1335746 RepID=A0A540VUJ2_9GAMM|nr:MAG: hypothetical protein FKY71_06675 [Spiribacter salinus]